MGFYASPVWLGYNGNMGQNGKLFKTRDVAGDSRARSGQAMLTAVLSISGAILGATTVAGFLMLYQLRASTDSENSAKAIFAADSGVEWTLFNYYCGQAIPARCTLAPDEEYPASPFSNGVVVSSTCYDDNDTALSCSNTSTISAITLGQSSNSRRAFALMLTSATSTK